MDEVIPLRRLGRSTMVKIQSFVLIVGVSDRGAKKCCDGRWQMLLYEIGGEAWPGMKVAFLDSF